MKLGSSCHTKNLGVLSFPFTPMPETLEPKVKETLRSYIRDEKSLNNEANKTSRFNALIGELFPGTKAVTEYPRGVEKVIRIDQAAGRRKGGRTPTTGTLLLSLRSPCPQHLRKP